MYIKEDLVYDKHSGQLIGFSSLGNVHLLAFERSVIEDQAEEIGLAKTMMAEASETALFAATFNKFFDILNVSNFTNGTRYRKPSMHPYCYGDDERLKVCV